MPLHMFMYCDQKHQIHQLVSKEEVEGMFGVDAVREFWGFTERSREAVRLLRELKRLSGLNWTEIGDLLGAGKSSVYRWLSGDSDPREGKLEELRRLAAEYALPGKTAGTNTNGKTSGKKMGKTPPTAPREFERLPKVSKDSKYSITNDTRLSTDAQEARPKEQSPSEPYKGKPGPTCGRCPLRDRPLVGGRGKHCSPPSTATIPYSAYVRPLKNLGLPVARGVVYASPQLSLAPFHNVALVATLTSKNCLS